jgi:hypothetical protein
MGSDLEGLKAVKPEKQYDGRELREFIHPQTRFRIANSLHCNPNLPT